MSKLTDEQILGAIKSCPPVKHDYAGWVRDLRLLWGRAIEAAATEPLLQRIAELEQNNRDLSDDVQRFRKHAMNEKAARMELERQLEEARTDAERYRWLFLPHTEESLSVAEQTQTMPKPSEQDAVIAHISAWYTPKSKADSIIDNAMQKGQS